MKFSNKKDNVWQTFSIKVSAVILLFVAGIFFGLQCLEAKRHFGGDVDIECLNRALEFCLEHKTYAMANLI